MSEPKQAGGLFAGDQRIPLRGVKIDVKASGAAAQVTVAQRYQNTEKVPVEAVYSFPLDESSAVCRFEVDIGGKRIVGKIEEREKAFEKYDAAMAQGHGAFLLDQDRPNIFTASVGNLMPGQEAVVLLTYATELEQTVDSIRMLIPTTIAPRYIPPDVARKMDPAELDHITPPAVLGGVPYGLKLNVELEAASDIREISCPSHPARVSLSGKKASVELMGENIQLDQDFVLTAKLAKSNDASALVARDSDGVRAVMVNLFPDLSKFKRGPCEFIFIVDRSGSMDGPSIEQARNALLLALRSLEEGDRFNVIGFGSTIDAMFKTSVAYSQSSLDEATKKVQALRADLGGTELLAPLQFVLEKTAAEKMPRQIVLLTDGEVGNESQIIELAAKHAATCRIFSFGIGYGASEHLVRGIARASGGRAEFIEPIVLRQFARMASASLTNVRVDWGNLKTDLVAPSDAPQLFDGDRLTIYGRVVGGSSGEVAVVADSPQGQLRFPARVDLEFVAQESAIPVLMARKAIQELEEGRGAARGSAQTNRKENAQRTRILELALRYQLMSSATSFVAIEERAANAQAQQPAELRRVPIALTKGWGALDEAAKSAPCVAAAAPAGGGGRLRKMAAPAAAIIGSGRRVAVGSPPPSPAPAKAGGTGIFGSIAGKLFDWKKSVGSVPPPPEPMPAQSESAKDMLMGNVSESATSDIVIDDIELVPSEDASVTNQVTAAQTAIGGMTSDIAFPKKSDLADDDLLALTAAQWADGSFEPSTGLLIAIKVITNTFDSVAKSLGGELTPARRIVATLAALLTLEARFPDRRDEWKMLADKAERWLAKQNVPVPAGFSDLKAWAKSELKM